MTPSTPVEAKKQTLFVRYIGFDQALDDYIRKVAGEPTAARFAHPSLPGAGVMRVRELVFELDEDTANHVKSVLDSLAGVEVV